MMNTKEVLDQILNQIQKSNQQMNIFPHSFWKYLISKLYQYSFNNQQYTTLFSFIHSYLEVNYGYKIIQNQPKFCSQLGKTFKSLQTNLKNKINSDSQAQPLQTQKQKQNQIEQKLQQLLKTIKQDNYQNISQKRKNKQKHNQLYFIRDYQDIQKLTLLTNQLQPSQYQNDKVLLCFKGDSKLIAQSFNEALNFYLSALKLYQDKQKNQSLTDDQTFQLSQLLFIIGVIYSQFLNYQLAIQYQQRALNIKKIIKPQSLQTADYATIFSNLGYCCLGGNYLDKALKYPQQSLQLYKILKIQQSTVLFQSLSGLGILYNRKYQFNEAIIYLEKCLQIQRNNPQYPFDLGMDNILSHIAQSYRGMGNYHKALQIQNQSIQIAKQTFGQNSSQVAIRINNMAVAYLGLGQYKKAEQYFLKCIQLQTNVQGQNSLSNAKTLSNLGLVYGKQGNSNKSLECYNKSLQIYKNNNILQSYDLASLILNIGALYLNKQQYQKASQYFHESLKMHQKIFGVDCIQSNTLLNNIGLTYFKLNNDEQGLKYLQKNLQMNKKALGQNSLEVAKVLNNIATSYYLKNKNYQKAAQYLHKKLQIQTQILGQSNIEVALTYNNLGMVYSQKQQHSKALQYLQKSQQIKLKIQSSDPSRISTTYSNIAEVYFTLGNYQLALQNFNKSLQAQLTKEGKYTYKVYNCYCDIVKVLNLMNDPIKLAEIIETSLEISSVVKPQQYKTVGGPFLVKLSQIYQKLNQYQLAYDKAKLSYQFLFQAVGQEHQYTMKAFNQMSKLQNLIQQQNTLNSSQ